MIGVIDMKVLILGKRYLAVYKQREGVKKRVVVAP